MYESPGPHLQTPPGERSDSARRRLSRSHVAYTSRSAALNRILARLIDSVLASLLLIGAVALSFSTSRSFAGFPGWSDSTFYIDTIFLTVATLSYPAYFVVFEYRAGRTPGKMLLNLKVTGVDGKPARLGNLVARTFLTLLVLSSGLYLVEAVVMLSRKNGLRITDDLTATRVIQLEFGAVPMDDPNKPRDR